MADVLLCSSCVLMPGVLMAGGLHVYSWQVVPTCTHGKWSPRVLMAAVLRLYCMVDVLYGRSTSCVLMVSGPRVLMAAVLYVYCMVGVLHGQYVERCQFPLFYVVYYQVHSEFYFVK